MWTNNDCKNEINKIETKTSHSLIHTIINIYGIKDVMQAKIQCLH